jgi:hypothetical protein
MRRVAGVLFWLSQEDGSLKRRRSEAGRTLKEQCQKIVSGYTSLIVTPGIDLQLAYVPKPTIVVLPFLNVRGRGSQRAGPRTAGWRCSLDFLRERRGDFEKRVARCCYSNEVVQESEGCVCGWQCQGSLLQSN